MSSAEFIRGKSVDLPMASQTTHSENRNDKPSIFISCSRKKITIKQYDKVSNSEPALYVAKQIKSNPKNNKKSHYKFRRSHIS